MSEYEVKYGPLDGTTYTPEPIGAGGVPPPPPMFLFLEDGRLTPLKSTPFAPRQTYLLEVDEHSKRRYTWLPLTKLGVR